MESNGNDFDPAEKEGELLRDAESWDTSQPLPAAPGDVPVIDVGPWFAEPDTRELARLGGELRAASEEVGFHQLVGHGLEQTLTADILDQARRFHALPLAVKRSIAMDRPDWPVAGVGYLPLGERKLPRRASGNLNQAFLLKSDRDIGFDDNQWLPESTLPGFRAAVEQYALSIEAVALRLLPIYAAALDLEPDFFEAGFRHPFWRLRLTHYPPGQPATGGEAYGIAPHVDTTFFTLLLPDGPGLTIFSHQRQAWIEVPVVEGALVVNSGELLKQWSNDRFLSTRHFANNTATHDRYSVPFFFNATADYPMTCLPTCHSPDNPPRYPPISYNQSQAAVQGE